MKKYFLSTLLLALPLLASAYDCQVDGIYYNLNRETNEAEVTIGDTKYSDEVTIPDKFTYEGTDYSVTSIGISAFYGCSGLTSVTIPNSVTSIEKGAFQGCSGLTSVIIPNSVTKIGWFAFCGCSSLTSVTIPNSVTSIEHYAFECCSGLTSVTIPDSVTGIGVMAFYNCGLTSVTIPNSVTSIREYAFGGCRGLTSVISKMENPCYIFSNCFTDDVFSNVKLYVPKGTVDKYKATSYWNKFVFIEEGEDYDMK